MGPGHLVPGHLGMRAAPLHAHRAHRTRLDYGGQPDGHAAGSVQSFGVASAANRLARGHRHHSGRTTILVDSRPCAL